MFKKVVATTFSAVLLLSNGIGLADSLPDNEQTLEVGLNCYRFSYSEVIGDSENGNMNGLHLSYKSQNQTTKQYWQARYDTTNSPTTYYYNGAIGGPTMYGLTDNKLTTGELIYATPVTDMNDQYVYIGYGYHSWNRDLTGVGGYLEKYSWSYIPIGLRTEYVLNKQWSGAVDLSLQFMFDGNMNTVGNGGASTGLGNLFHLGSLPGFRAEFPFTHKINTHCSVVLTPWYQYSAIGQSNSVNGYLEPNSATSQYGVNAGLSYKF